MLDAKFDIGTQVSLCSEITGIDATTIADTKIFHIPYLSNGLTAQNFKPMLLLITCTSFTSGGKATEAVINVGDTAAAYSEWINGSTITISGTKVVLVPLVTTEHKVFTSGTDIYLRVATASDATAEVWTVHLFGFMW